MFEKFADKNEHFNNIHEVCMLLQGQSLVVPPVGGYLKKHCPFPYRMISAMKKEGLHIRFETIRRGYAYGSNTIIEARNCKQALGFAKVVYPDSYCKALHYMNEVPDLKKCITNAPSKHKKKPTICVVGRDGVVFGREYGKVCNVFDGSIQSPDFSCKEYSVDVDALLLAVAYLLYENQDKFGYKWLGYRQGGNNDTYCYFTFTYPDAPEPPLPEL